MSTGSVSSNHSAPIEQTDLGWKEGHILKGLKRLQMHKSKEASSLPSVPHCKDCMTSNEGIYSLGVKCGQQVTTANQTAPSSKTFHAEAGVANLDSDDPDDESPKLPNRETNDQPTQERLRLEKLDISRDSEQNVHEGCTNFSGNSGLFPSPDSDNLSILEAPTIKPGVSPTDSLTHLEEINQESMEKHKTSSLKFSDQNNNQERSTDRKSRLDYNKRHQGRSSTKQVEVPSKDMSLSLKHTATRALSCMNEARQRSSSMEVPHRREPTSQSGSDSKVHATSESPQRKPKSLLCDSARKAFILRSKSADGGQEQHRYTHSPLHQKLIKAQKSKGQSDPNHSRHSVPSKMTNINKTNGSGKGSLSKAEQQEDVTVSPSSKSLENVQQISPLVSPVKHSKILKSPGVKECSKSPIKSSLQISRLSSSDSVEDSIYDNLPCSPRKQRRQDQQSDVLQTRHRSPSPPPPPGRTTSLVLRHTSDSISKDEKLASQAQTSVSGKPTSTTAKTQSNQLSSALQIQQSNTIEENQHIAQLGIESKPLKDKPANLYAQSSKIASVPVQESQASESVKLSMERMSTCVDENGASSIISNHNILQRSQQSISEPKLSEVLPPTYSNVYYHGIAHNSQISSSRAVKRTLPVNAKSHEAISGQESSTFLIFGRQNKDDAKSVQSFQTFSCNSQMIKEYQAPERASRKIETRCNSLDSEPVQPIASDSGVMLDWGFDEEGWLFKRSVSVSTRPLLKPVMGMNGAKARSQSFGARYMDRPSFNRSGKVRTQIKTHSGSSLNSLGDVLPGSMSCSSSYHCPMNRSLLNNFLIEEGLTAPSHLGSSSERLQSLKLQREQARRLQIEQQFSSAFGEPVSEEPERQSTITTIEEKVMLGIEENLHKCQEQERTTEVKQKSGSSIASWFGFRKSKLPAPSSKKTDPPKVKEEKREQKITSLLGGKNAKSDKKRDRRKSDGKDW